MATETIGRAGAPPEAAAEADARAPVASAWAWLRDGERWAQGRATIPDAGAEGGVRACSVGALSMAGGADGERRAGMRPKSGQAGRRHGERRGRRLAARVPAVTAGPGPLAAAGERASEELP